MIFVTVGTQNNSFNRLFEKIDEMIEYKKINEKVIAQIGYSKYIPKHKMFEVIDFMDKDQFKQTIQDANFVITHGGVGSILSCLKERKKVIAIPRDKKFKEHVNNHQYQIVESFNESKYIIGISSIEQLEKALEDVKGFIPQEYPFDNSSLLNIVDEFIKENLN